MNKKTLKIRNHFLLKLKAAFYKSVTFSSIRVSITKGIILKEVEAKSTIN